jgi:hypothetical protein
MTKRVHDYKAFQVKHEKRISDKVRNLLYLEKRIIENYIFAIHIKKFKIDYEKFHIYF